MSSCDRFKPRKTRVASNLQHKRPKSRKSKVSFPGSKVLDVILEPRSGPRPTGKRGRRPRITKGNSKHHLKELSLIQSNSLHPCFKSPVKQHILERDIFISSDNQMYAVGETAYIQSDTISTPYFIGQILDFKTSRKDEILAEIQWFYRPSEVPASVLESLMQDRCLQADNIEENITKCLIDNQVRSRELFRSGQTNNLDCYNFTPVSLFRGKCKVLALSDILDLRDFTKKDDNFFCILGFDPITRRLSDFKGEIRIGASHQATLPIASKTSHLSDTVIESQLWIPNNIEDSELQMYLKATRSIAMHSGWCLRGRLDDGLLAMQSDRLTQDSYNLLHNDQYCTKTSLKHILRKPNAFEILYEKSWALDESKNFYKGIRKFGKHFKKIRDEFLPEKNFSDLVFYYYHWKRSSVGLASRTQRKTRKALHLKKNRNEGCSKSHPSLHDLFIEMFSADELEAEDDNASIDPSECNLILQSSDVKNRICQHCYSSNSHSWHHGGLDNLLLCDHCRIFYCKYSQMPKIHNISDPPLHILRDVSQKDLVHKINEDRFLMENISCKSNRGLSESSEYSDSDSIISDTDKIHSDFIKLHSPDKVSLTFESDVTTVDNTYHDDKSISSVPLIPNLYPDIDNKTKPGLNPFTVQNNELMFSSIQNEDHQRDIARQQLNFSSRTLCSPAQSEDSDNLSILKSLLQCTVKNSQLNRSEIHVFGHNQEGYVISNKSYEDNFIDESNMDSTSESPSPTIKKDIFLYPSEPRQGAARLDFKPKPNISELISRRQMLNLDSIGLASSRSKESAVNISNVSLVSPQIPTLSHVHTISDSLINQSYPDHFVSQLPHPCESIQSTPHLVYSDKDNFKKFLINPKYGLIDNNASQNINPSKNPPKISNQSSISYSHPCSPSYNQLIDDVYVSNSSQPFSQICVKGAEFNSHISNSNSFSHNLMMSKNRSLASDQKEANMGGISNSETEQLGLHKNCSINMNSSNTLQPQIPSSNQILESSILSQDINSENPCPNSTQSLQNRQIPIQANQTLPGLSFPNLNPLQSLISNNIFVSHDTSNSPHYLNFHNSADKLSLDLSNVEKDKTLYQNYLNMVYSNQMNAYFLSQIPTISPSNPQIQVPYQGHLVAPQMNSQMAHVAQFPPQFIQNQSQHTTQSQTNPQIFPISSELLSQYPIIINPGQIPKTDLNDKNI